MGTIKTMIFQQSNQVKGALHCPCALERSIEIDALTKDGHLIPKQHRKFPSRPCRNNQEFLNISSLSFHVYILWYIIYIYMIILYICVLYIYIYIYIILIINDKHTSFAFHNLRLRLQPYTQPCKDEWPTASLLASLQRTGPLHGRYEYQWQSQRCTAAAATDQRKQRRPDAYLDWNHIFYCNSNHFNPDQLYKHHLQHHYYCLVEL